jgi:photosystem II stability/assembly factor-like uncharacterized protein
MKFLQVIAALAVLVSASVTLLGTEQGSMYSQVPLPAEGIFGAQVLDRDGGIVYSHDHLWITADRGGNWQPLSIPRLGEGGFITEVYFLSRAFGWLVVSGTAVFLTDDGGKTWRSSSVGADRPVITKLFFLPSAETGWAAGAVSRGAGTAARIEPVVFVTRDRGHTWTGQSVPSNVGSEFHQIGFLSALDGFALDNKVYYSRDGGVTWFRSTVPKSFGVRASARFPDVARAAAFSGERTVWVSFDSGPYGGFLLRSCDSGVTFRLMSRSSRVSFHQLQFVSPQQGWAVDRSGTLYATADGGHSWTKTCTGLRVLALSVLNAQQIGRAHV